MHKLITPIIALVLAAGVAACGSSGSGNATAAGTTPAAGSSGTATAGASSTPTASAASSTTQSGSADTQQQVSTQAEQIISRLSKTSTQLAAGKISTSQARSQLRSLRSQSMLLVKNAKHLAATSPMRVMLVAIGNRLSAYTARLDTSQLTAAGRQALRKSSAALTNLEAQVRGAVAHGKTPSLNQITSDLQALASQSNSG